MTYLQYTEFKKRSKFYFDEVENGESFVITRRGYPIAEFVPIKKNNKNFKRKFKKVELKKKINLTEFIMVERREDCPQQLQVMLIASS